MHVLDSIVLASLNEDMLVKVLLQLSIIILAARIAAIAFKRIGQPPVVGEICAGLMLGPSLFGYFFPELSATIFDKSVHEAMYILKELGLILLLFLIGLEFDFGYLKTHGRAAATISIAGIVLPFGMGWIMAQWLYPALGNPLNAQGKPIDLNGFAMFMGTAMSITALPVLGRIMMELNITRTRLASITITAAAVGDAAGWIILATVTALVSASFNAVNTAVMVAMVFGFGMVMMFIVRPLMLKWIAVVLPRQPETQAETPQRRAISLNALAVLFIVIFLCSIATSQIGIFAIFGAFALGAVLSSELDFHHAVTERLRDFVTVFFLPIFFTSTGLNTDIGSLGSAQLWLAAALVCGVAIAGKFGGCTLAAKASGFTWRDSGCIGVMMNARGLMELIVINKGYELGVIPKSVFCMLVIMAVVTTIMTSPILRWLSKGTELEACIKESALSK